MRVCLCSTGTTIRPKALLKEDQVPLVFVPLLVGTCDVDTMYLSNEGIAEVLLKHFCTFDTPWF